MFFLYLTFSETYATTGSGKFALLNFDPILQFFDTQKEANYGTSNDYPICRKKVENYQTPTTPDLLASNRQW